MDTVVKQGPSPQFRFGFSAKRFRSLKQALTATAMEEYDQLAEIFAGRVESRLGNMRRLTYVNFSSGL